MRGSYPSARSVGSACVRRAAHAHLECSSAEWSRRMSRRSSSSSGGRRGRREARLRNRERFAGSTEGSQLHSERLSEWQNAAPQCRHRRAHISDKNQRPSALQKSRLLTVFSHEPRATSRRLLSHVPDEAARDTRRPLSAHVPPRRLRPPLPSPLLPLAALRVPTLPPPLLTFYSCSDNSFASPTTLRMAGSCEFREGWPGCSYLSVCGKADCSGKGVTFRIEDVLLIVGIVDPQEDPLVYNIDTVLEMLVLQGGSWLLDGHLLTPAFSL